MSDYYPDVIELVPNATGSYVPDFNARPATAAPIVPYVPPTPPAQVPYYREPPTTPNYDSGGRGMSDADLRDFGTDDYGRPIAQRNPVTGRAEFNPELGFTPQEIRDAENALNDYPGNRGSRRNAGRAIGNAFDVLPVIGDAIGIAGAIDGILRPILDPITQPIGGAIGRGIGQLTRDLDCRLFGLCSHQGAPTGDINVPGAGAHPQGQCETGYLINFYISGTTSQGKHYSNADSVNASQGYGTYQGPLSAPYTFVRNGIPRVTVNDRFGQPTYLGNLNGLSNPSFALKATRVDGQSDSCGDRLPGRQPTAPAIPQDPTRPGFKYPRLPGFENPFPTGLPRLPGFDLPSGSPFGKPFNPTIPIGGGSNRPSPGYDGLPDNLPAPGGQDLPAPGGQGGGGNPSPPTPSPECCPSTERSLSEILRKLQGSGNGTFDLSPCNQEGTRSVRFSGEGLAGIYGALAALTQSLNLIHSDTKCPPEIELPEIEGLDEMLSLLRGSGSGSLDISPCEDSEPGEGPIEALYNGSGVSGLYSAIAAITKSLNLIHTDTKCPPEDCCVAAVPDWWQMRPGADRPQLSIVFRKGIGRNYHALNIPHPKVTAPNTVSPIGAYTSGSYQATLVLIDNSKFIVNANSVDEARRVALEAAEAIDPAMLGDLRLSITERRGYPVTIDAMEPRYIQYFPDGQKNRMPAWRRKTS